MSLGEGAMWVPVLFETTLSSSVEADGGPGERKESRGKGKVSFVPTAPALSSGETN